jgi:L-fuculose-phosphate aldolase
MNERDARTEIAEYCARLWERRLVRGTSGNVSIRLDDGEIIVTPSGRSLCRLAPADFVRIAADGTPHETAAHPTSELPLHLAAYRLRPDAGCLVHTHPTFCVVWSLQGRVFPRDTVGSRETLGAVAWTPFRPNGSSELAELCASEFARGTNIVLMERHGLSAIGATLELAFNLTDQAEEAARVAYFSMLALRGRATMSEKRML